MIVFQRMYFPGHVGGGIGGRHGTGGLENDGSFVVVFVHEVDGNARLGFARRYNGFVYVPPIHALAAEFR